MKQFLGKAVSFFQRNTSGLPFLLWAILGASVAFFVIYCRDFPNVEFESLKYILVLGGVWFVASDVLKKHRLLEPRLHFWADAVFYAVLFNLIIMLTGGFGGGLVPLLVAAMISAPFFGGSTSTLIFSLVLIGSSLVFYFKDSSQVSPYHTGLMLLYAVSDLVVVLMVRSFLGRQKDLEEEKIRLATDEVRFKTKELQETLDELNKNREALRDKIGRLEQFQKLVIGRELKMIELKDRIRELEERKEKKTKKKP